MWVSTRVVSQWDGNAASKQRGNQYQIQIQWKHLEPQSKTLRLRSHQTTQRRLAFKVNGETRLSALSRFLPLSDKDCRAEKIVVRQNLGACRWSWKNVTFGAT